MEEYQEEGDLGTEGGGANPFGGLAIKRPPRPGLEVKILFTTPAGTVAALRLVSRLGAGLDVHPVVLLFQAVPYTLPLSWPTVSEHFFEQRLRELERESPSEIYVRIYLCRNSRECLRQILPPNSLIVVGGRKGWRGGDEQRIARRLANEGHEVIFAALD